MTTEQLILFIDKLVWPLLIIFLYFLNKRSIDKVFNSLVKRIENGAELQISSFKVGQSPPISLPSPKKDEEVNENHIALLHSSWRYKKKDKEFKKEMYVIQVIVQANKDVLDRIEFVKYLLHSSYPNKIQTKTERENNFELKELAWGEFNLKAEVKIKGQIEIIKLARYINLTETGQNILEK